MRIHALVLTALLVGCSTSNPAPVAHPDAAGTGGTTVASTGGQAGTGGATATGGTNSAGGAGGSPMGGTKGTGGNTLTGGNGSGPSATGGRETTGGSSGTAGRTSTGGFSGAGGGTSRGGTSGTGGGAGGASGAGGSTASAPDGGSDTRDATAGERGSDALATDTRAAGADLAASDVSTTTTVTVYVVGDSTVSTYTNSSIHQAGWGQFLQDYFSTNAKIVNKAVGGMTARHFIEAGYLDGILASIKTGDYLLVQFGTNDGNKTATYTLPGSTTEIPYYLDPQTDFKTYLTKYVDATKAKGATTIFVTPPPRHSCSAGEMGVKNGTGGYATAMKELGPTLGAPVVDLNGMVIAYLANVTCENSGSTFFLVKADGSIDSTHFQETGAKVMASLVADGATGISTLGIPLSAYVK